MGGRSRPLFHHSAMVLSAASCWGVKDGICCAGAAARIARVSARNLRWVLRKRNRTQTAYAVVTETHTAMAIPHVAVAHGLLMFNPARRAGAVRFPPAPVRQAWRDRFGRPLARAEARRVWRGWPECRGAPRAG